MGQLDTLAAIERHIAKVLESHRSSVVEADEDSVADKPARVSVRRGARPTSVIGADHGPGSVIEQQIAKQQTTDEETHERIIGRICGDVIVDLVDGFDVSWTRVAIGRCRRGRMRRRWSDAAREYHCDAHCAERAHVKRMSNTCALAVPRRSYRACGGTYETACGRPSTTRESHQVTLWICRHMPKQKSPALLRDLFVFLVEPWGIEPQTSRVRLWMGREISRPYLVATFPRRDSPSRISGNVCDGAGRTHDGILSSSALLFDALFRLQTQPAAAAARAMLATLPASQRVQPVQHGRLSASAAAFLRTGLRLSRRQQRRVGPSLPEGAGHRRAAGLHPAARTLGLR